MFGTGERVGEPIVSYDGLTYRFLCVAANRLGLYRRRPPVVRLKGKAYSPLTETERQ